MAISGSCVPWVNSVPGGRGSIWGTNMMEARHAGIQPGGLGNFSNCSSNTDLSITVQLYKTSCDTKGHWQLHFHLEGGGGIHRHTEDVIVVDV